MKLYLIMFAIIIHLIPRPHDFDVDHDQYLGISIYLDADCSDLK